MYSEREIREVYAKVLARVLEVGVVDPVDYTTPLMQLGVSSIQLTEIKQALEEGLKLDIEPTFFFQFATLESGAQELAERQLGPVGEWLYKLRWQARPSQQSQLLAPKGHWLVFADQDRRYTDPLCRYLLDCGQTYHLVTRGNRYEKLDENRTVLRSDSPEDLDLLLEDVCDNRPILACIYLWGCQELQSTAINDLRVAHQDALVGLQCLSTRMRLNRGMEQTPLWVVSDSWPESGDESNLIQAPLSGLVRVINAELAGAKTHSIAFDSSHPLDEISRLLVEEVLSASNDTHVAYLDGDRYVPRLSEPVDGELSARAVDFEGSYLVVVSSSGMGHALIRWYQERGAHHIYVIEIVDGDNPDGTDALDLPDIGGVSWQQVRVSQFDDFEAAVSEALSGQRPLKGLVQAAGVLEDETLHNLHWDKLQLTYTLKVECSWRLHELCSGHDLDHFILFGSSLHLLDGLGLGAHAIGNSFLEGLSFHRQALGLPALLLRWGGWSTEHVSVKRMVKSISNSSFTSLVLDQALKALDLVLSSDTTDLVVADIEWDRVFLGGVGSQNLLAEDIGVSRGYVKSNLWHDFQQTAERASVIETYLSGALGRVTGKKIPNDDGTVQRTHFEELTPLECLSLQQAIQRDLEDYVAVPNDFVEKGLADGNLANALRSLLEGARVSRLDPGSGQQEPIAVIGMACRFPGARNYREFWHNLMMGLDSTRTVPAGRWTSEDEKEALRQTEGRLVKRGGFIADVDGFDPLFFGLSPKEASFIDPQHRLFLQAAWEAIEDAGYTSQDLFGERVGVYAGVSKNDYAELMRAAGADIAPWVSTGTVHSILSARVSYLLNLRGPSESVDTACSSSIVALHSAVKDLQSRESKMALVGGVNALLSPTMFVSHTRSGMLAPDGRCKTFDSSADGYARGEGVGVLLLKPLQDALRDGDPVHAIIRGTAVNQNGKGTTMTAPSVSAQAEVVQAAIHRASVDPATISFIETHGTGTPLGDPIEVDGLKLAFQGIDDMDCVLGAVKTNIGHLESASGMAGIIKMILSMKMKSIPPNLNFQALNPKLEIDNAVFRLADSFERWSPTRDHAPIVRRGGVSSFGMGGTNTHVVLEESQPLSSETGTRESVYLFPVSAQKGRLHAYLEEFIRYFSWCEEYSQLPEVTSLSWTLQHGRDHFDERIVFAARDLEELLEAMSRVVSGGTYEPPALGEDVQCLAEQWLAGEEVPWVELWDGKPRRLNGLPTYPFEQKRCWFKVDGASSGSGGRLGDVSAVEVTQRLSPHEFFLSDHIVKGQSILPGVMYLELVRRVLASTIGSKLPLRFEDVEWLTPIVVHEQAHEAQVALAGEKLEEFHVRCGETIHCKGRITSVAPPDPTMNLDALAEIQTRCVRRTDHEAIYERMAQHGLKQGPGFRVLRNVRSNQREALAEISLPEGLPLEADALHPSIMDAVFQTVVTHHFLEHSRDSRQYLPFFIESIVQYQPLQSECVAYVKERADSQEGQLLKYDMLLVARDGQTLVEFTGFARRPYRNQRSDQVVQLEESIFYLPQRTARPANTVRSSEGPLLVFSSSESLVARLRQLFRQRRVIAVRPGPQYEKHGDGTFFVDMASTSGFDELCADLQAEGLRVSDLVLDWRFFYVWPLVSLLQALMKSRIYDNLLILRLFGKAQSLEAAQDSMVGGVARVLIYENPQMELRSVRADISSEEEWALIIRDELCSSRDCPLLEVDYTAGQRSVLEVNQASLVAVEDSELLNRECTVLISGGVGGLSRAISSALASAYQCRFVLLGRSPESPEIKAHLEELRSRGAEAIYSAADITDLEALEKAFGALPEEFQELHAVIHAAGIKQDAFILRKEKDAFNRVTDVKVRGALNLDALTKSMDLRFFVVFSSIASLIPNQGQADYAAGNSFLDRFAELRNDMVTRHLRHGRTLAINWPLWADGGMKVSEDQEQHLREEFGMDPLPTEVGVEAFTQILAYAQTTQRPLHQVIVIDGDKDLIEAAFAGGVPNSETPDSLDTIPAALSTLIDTQLDAWRFQKRFDGDLKVCKGFSYQGEAAVPGACFVEMGRQAAAIRYPNRTFNRISDNYWPSALELPQSSQNVTVDLSERENGVFFEIATESEGDRILHASGLVREGTDQSTESPPALDAICGKANGVLSSEEFYETIHQNADLRLDAPFRPVTQFWHSDSEAVAELQHPASSWVDPDHYGILPVIFTGLEQCLLVHTALCYRSILETGMRLMPISIEDIQVHSQFTRVCRIYLKAELPVAEGQRIQRYSAFILSEAGETVATVRGNVMRIIPEKKATGSDVASQGGTEKASSTISYLQRTLAYVLDMEPKELHPDHDFDRFGVDSRMVTELNAMLEKDFPGLSKTLFFEFANIRQLSQYLEQEFPGQFTLMDTSQEAGAAEGSPSDPHPPSLGQQQAEMEQPRGQNEGSVPGPVQYLQSMIGGALDINPSSLDPDANFDSFGIDSRIVTELNSYLEQDFPALSKTLFFEFSNIRDLSGYLLEAFPDFFAQEERDQTPSDEADSIKSSSLESADSEPALQPASSPDVDSLAVIGVSLRLPGATNTEEFWGLLKEGHCMVEPSPLHQDLYQSDLTKDARAETLCQWGAPIDGVDQFDPMYFGISAKDSVLIDPQERLFLQVAWEALQDAALPPESVDSSKRRIGVYVGALWQDYAFLGLEEGLRSQSVPVSSMLYSIANRVSYTFDLSGPSFSVDSACSSSLTALHLACEALKRGECEAAIVGGVNLNLHPSKYGFLNKLDFLSDEGKCRSYGESGNGYVPGEGVVALVVKTMKQAIKDGDPIYGEILATGINHGGRTRGYTVPNPQMQAGLIAKVIEESGVNARDISYVEGHGTGTALGDPIEVRGLDLAFSQMTSDKQFCALASVKANIGHLEAAAGLASIVKVLLQMEKEAIAPALFVEQTNPSIDFPSTCFFVPKRLMQWAAQQTRVAGVSSFGAGGSYAHAIVRESPKSGDRQVDEREQLVLLSAKKPRQLQQYAQRLLDFIWEHPDVPLCDIATTLALGRSQLPYRAAAIVKDRGDLIALLNSILDSEKNYKNLSIGTASVSPQGEMDLQQLSLDQIGDAWVAGGTLLTGNESAKKVWTGQKIHLPPLPLNLKSYWIQRREEGETP